jgi:hypothetical protein
MFHPEAYQIYRATLLVSLYLLNNPFKARKIENLHKKGNLLKSRDNEVCLPGGGGGWEGVKNYRLINFVINGAKFPFWKNA